MKRNAQLLLLALYHPTTGGEYPVAARTLSWITPGLTNSGFRSLLIFIEKKQWIQRDKVGNSWLVTITETGKRALEAKFPALKSDWKDWDGRWQLMVFLRAPKADAQFRYLRSLLIKEKAVPVSRGVYAAAGSFSSKVLEETRQTYEGSVLICSVDEWQIGSLRPIITNYYDLADIANIYSGISTEIERLLPKISGSKKATDQQKVAIATVIDRFAAALTNDPGFSRIFFPDVPDALRLIPKLQQLIKL